MKTFQWTVPEFPMTKREMKPPVKREGGGSGIGWIVTGVLFSSMSLMYFSISSGFVKGVRSYFWASGVGTVLSSDLRMHTNSGGGTVTYSIEIDGAPVEDTAEVFKRFSGDKPAKYKEWSARYAEGADVRVLYNRSGETSPGHWPASYSLQFGIQGISMFLLGLTFIFRGSRRILAARVASADGRTSKETK